MVIEWKGKMTVAEHSHNLELLKNLYELAAEIRGIEPWKWMSNTDIFGVKDPRSENIGFVSIMGAHGEHHAVAVYRNPEALYDFFDLKDPQSPFRPEHIFEISQLHTSFKNKNDLDAEERKILKKLKIKFSGENSWPMFRSFKPGMVPWFLSEEEAQFLYHVLQQTLHVLIRLVDGILELPTKVKNNYLIRVGEKCKNQIAWDDKLIRIDRPAQRIKSLTVDGSVIKVLKEMPFTEHSYEIDLCMLPSHSKNSEGRQYYLYLLLVVDSSLGIIMGNDLLRAEPTYDEMWNTIPFTVSGIFAKVNKIPKQIIVRTKRMHAILQPFTHQIGSTLIQKNDLPNIKKACESLMDTFLD